MVENRFLFRLSFFNLNDGFLDVRLNINCNVFLYNAHLS